MRYPGSKRVGLATCFYLLDIVLAANSCSSATILSQDDAIAISSCSTITGNIVLAGNAKGSIALDGVQIIEGSLQTEPCSDSTSCSGVVSLSSSTLSMISSGLALQSLSNLVNISFPKIVSTGPKFSLHDLPTLQNVSIPNLASTEAFSISNTPNLTSLTLDILQNVTSVYINNVALSTLPSISSISKITSFTVSNINNVAQFVVNTSHIGLLDIQGNGSLSLSLIDTGTPANSAKQDFQVLSVDTFSLSGCANIYVPDTTITVLNATHNNARSFGFQQIVGLKDIYIIDNDLLEEIEWPGPTPVLNNVTISISSALDIWNSLFVQNISNVILTGGISTVFANQLQPNFVLGDFLLSSTEAVDCGQWDRLRSSGHVLGNYSCQGKTVPIKKSGAVRNGFRSGAVVWLTAVLMAIFCLL